jgi:hypothetical protein
MILYTADGAVAVPPSQAALLTDVSPRLALRWHVGVGSFYVGLQWSPDDERHAKDPSARAEERDWSIECFIPSDVRLEDMASWALRRMARGGSDAAGMVEDHARRVSMLNEARPNEIADTVLHEVQDSVRVDAPSQSMGKRRTRVR